jgi:hypothetical protein
MGGEEEKSMDATMTTGSSREKRWQDEAEFFNRRALIKSGPECGNLNGPFARGDSLRNSRPCLPLKRSGMYHREVTCAGNEDPETAQRKV